MKILNEYKNKIENELKRFFKIKKAEAKNINYELLKFVEAFEEFTLRGGKRLRGLLIISTYAGCGKKVSNEIIKAAASMELLHSFLLVHDDIMDNDDLRRNGLTVHKIFQKKYNSADLGKAFGIVVGDLGYSYALELFLSAKFEVRSKLDALNGIAVMIKRCCYGQLMDVMSTLRKVDDDFVQCIHQYKTAHYTVAGPMVIGAKLAGCSKSQINSFNEIGIKLGLAFQLRDDILGVFGSQKVLGKPIASDLVEGKKTLLVVKAKSNYVNKKIGRKLNLKEINKIKKIIVDSGSLQHSELLIKKLLAEAREDIVASSLKDKEKKQFLYLVDYLEKRRS